MLFLSSPRAEVLIQEIKTSVLIIFFLLITLVGIFLSKAVFASEKIDINKAPLEELIKIVHIGETRALELISLRPFSSLDELNKINGIGEARIKDIKEQGLAQVVDEEYWPSPETEVKENLMESKQKINEETKPKIFPAYPQEISANKDLEIKISVFGLKNGFYDVKISIDKEKTLSNIYNENEQKWQSSHYYIKNLFLDNSFFKNPFKLKLKEENFNFQGEAEILIRIRESGKSQYFEHKDKIIILSQESPPLPIKQQEAAIADSVFFEDPTNKRDHKSPSFFLFASALALFSGATIIVLKKTLKTNA